MNRKILITGGLGYVGGRLSCYLRSLGASLRLATRRAQDEYPAWCRDVEVVQADLQAGADLSRLCAGMDCIIHLAAMHQNDCAADPVQAVTVNGEATVKLLRAAQKAGVERVIYFSTIHVYGAPLSGTITEATLPRPNHPYAITHRLAEDFVLAAHDRQELAGLVLRLSNAVGAPVDPGIKQWGLIVNNLCRQAVQDGKLVLNSSGLQHRDFITFIDVERIVAHFLDLPIEKWTDGIFNVGGENSITIFAMAEMIAAQARKTLGIEVPIQRPQPAPGKEWPAIDYRIDKLKAAGFAMQGRLQDEIDATLEMCGATFEKPGS